jgi:hypothetical protein
MLYLIYTPDYEKKLYHNHGALFFFFRFTNRKIHTNL